MRYYFLLKNRLYSFYYHLIIYVLKVTQLDDTIQSFLVEKWLSINLWEQLHNTGLTVEIKEIIAYDPDTGSLLCANEMGDPLLYDLSRDQLVAITTAKEAEINGKSGVVKATSATQKEIVESSGGIMAVDVGRSWEGKSQTSH